MGEKGEIVRVNDPILRWLFGIVGALVCWGLLQINEQGNRFAAMHQRQEQLSEALQAIKAQADNRQTYLESSLRSSEAHINSTLTDMKQDIRAIRSLVEKHP